MRTIPVISARCLAILLLAMGVSGGSASGQEPWRVSGQEPPRVSGQEPWRVFFLGRSAFGASGGIPSPFQRICSLAGTPCVGHRHWDFVEHVRSNGLAPRVQGLADDPRVEEILGDQSFDIVVFSVFDFNTEFYSTDPAYVERTLAAAETVYTWIVESGARPFIYVPYATLDNPGDGQRIERGVGRVVARLDSLATVRGSPRVVAIPAGRFFGAMHSAFGAERWYADSQHPSEFGQYATARLLFSYITARDPTTFGHPEWVTPAEAERIDATILRMRDAP